MKKFIKIYVAAALTNLLPVPALPAEITLQTLSTTELEKSIKEIDSELETLAHLSLRSGVGAIGFRSVSYETPDHEEWFQIELDGEQVIDQIVLIPTVWRHAESGLLGDGFPQELQVIVGTGNDTNGTVIASYEKKNDTYPGIAPYIISCTNQTASWVRIKATKLATRHHDNRYIFQLSEIMVFSGSKNIALHRPVTTSSPRVPNSRSWLPGGLTDGFTPYLMNAAHGNQSLAFICDPKDVDVPMLTLDMGKTYPIDTVALHAVDQSDTVPQSSSGDLAIPRRMVIEGANQPDFSDAVELLELNVREIYETGPIMMWNIEETPCRYVRLIIYDPYQNPDYASLRKRVGFAEIEIFSHDRNVAVNRVFTGNFSDSIRESRELKSLTDGKNLYGNILPIRTWIDQLARRRDLEIERPHVLAELNHRYVRQKTNLRYLLWLTGILVVGTFIIIIIDQFLRQRAVYKTRERIAANLHDELGANLHAIGLLGDHAKDQVEAAQPREELAELVDTLNDIRSFTEQAGAATRYCTNMLECPGLYENLPVEMQRIAKRLLIDIQHESSFENTARLGTLKKRACIDLYLFYKECLTNVVRHASATHVSSHFTVSDKELQLTVSDNGCGLNSSKEPPMPKALKRRARMLRAHLDIQSVPEGGTTVKLTCSLRKIRRKKTRNSHA
ncbi:histidine kinase [Pontiellaceae bacterium B1224]|nr:histidine kinase [Pontiellaceae bacterium B1224]